MTRMRVQPKPKQVDPNKVFKVRVRYTVEEVMEVEAENVEEAEDAAIDGMQFSPHGDMVDWEVQSVTELGRHEGY